MASFTMQSACFDGELMLVYGWLQRDFIHFIVFAPQCEYHLPQMLRGALNRLTDILELFYITRNTERPDFSALHLETL